MLHGVLEAGAQVRHALKARFIHWLLTTRTAPTPPPPQLLAGGPAPPRDVRTADSVAPWLLSGLATADWQLDLSGFHTALLFVNSTLAAAGCVRVLGRG